MRPRAATLIPILAGLLGGGLILPGFLSSSSAQVLRQAQVSQPATRKAVPAPPASAQPPATASQAAPPLAGPAQPPTPPNVVIEILHGQHPKIKLAIPSFRAGVLGGDLQAASRELEDTVRADLDFSSYFDILGPEAFRQVVLSGDIPRDLPAIAAQGSEVALLGAMRAEGDRLVFEGRLFDIGSGKAIVEKRYRGPVSVARRMAHTFADEVVRYLTGAPGIALSSIAFTSDRTGFKEIFVMDYDGHNERRITGHRSISMSPAWSPNGEAIAYTSFLGGSPGIYLADLATGQKRPLVTSGSLNITPSFSPDGSQITFARSLEGNVEIFTADRNGGRLRRLTTSPAIDTNPAWSPKGGEIAFTSNRAGNPHIYLMDVEGTSQRRITFEGTYNDGAAWSPSGDRIAFTSRRDGVFQIAVVDVASLETKVLTSGGGESESPAFSPDGRKIVFTSRRGGSKQLYVMDAKDGSNSRPLTEAGNNDMADWSRHTDK